MRPKLKSFIFYRSLILKFAKLVPMVANEYMGLAGHLWQNVISFLQSSDLTGPLSDNRPKFVALL